MDLINLLPVNSSVNTVQYVIEEAVFSASAVTSHDSGQRPRDVFSVDPTNVPTDWLDNDHVICVYCRSMSILQLYKGVTEFIQGSYESVISLRSSGEFFCWAPRFQGDWTRNGKKTSQRFEVLVSVLRSVARRWLVEIENPSACTTLNGKVSKSVIVLY
jgi:hypothetical protein